MLLRCAGRAVVGARGRGYAVRFALGAQRRRCSERRIYGDEDLIAEHEAATIKHKDIFWPVLRLLQAGTAAWVLVTAYTGLTKKNEQGKAFMDDLIFHKSDKILGDKPKEHTTHPTLLLDVYDVVCCMTYRNGSKAEQVVLRPGADVFLDRLKNHYEIVIYSLCGLTHLKELHARIDHGGQRGVFSYIIPRELIKRIDCGYWPYGIVPSFLAPRYKKNLNDVGRRLERVVHIECNEESLYDDPAQDDNRILIPAYDGRDDDKELIYLLPFLEYLADKSRAPFDVRNAIHFYKKKADEYGVQNIGVAYTLYQEEKARSSKQPPPSTSLLSKLF